MLSRERRFFPALHQNLLKQLSCTNNANTNKQQKKTSRISNSALFIRKIPKYRKMISSDSTGLFKCTA